MSRPGVPAVRGVLLVMAACHASAAAPRPAAAPDEDAAAAAAPLAAVPPAALCVTHGKLASGDRAAVRDAAVRAVAQGTRGDAAELHFTYRGASARTSRLASGEVREQLGLKLRAADGCNLVYVVWRFAPKAELVVQTKINAGAHDHQQCGTSGYAKVRPAQRSRIAAPAPGSDHVLGAAIVGRELTATIDGAPVWRGTLPAAARGLRGPVGLRTDNIAADLDLYAAAGGTDDSGSKCEPGQGEE